MEGSYETGLRRYSIVMTFILILYKIPLYIILNHTTESYGSLILPAKKALKTQYRINMRAYQARLKGRDLDEAHKNLHFPNDTPQYVDLIWDDNGYDMTNIFGVNKDKTKAKNGDTTKSPGTDRKLDPAKK